jgi:hypothetical protein
MQYPNTIYIQTFLHQWTMFNSVEPLLYNNCKISKYTRAVSRQRLSKHIPMAMHTHATIEVLLETAFSTWSVQRGYKEDNWSKNSSFDSCFDMKPKCQNSGVRGESQSHPFLGDVGGGVFYLGRLKFMHQGIADCSSRVWRQVQITSTVALWIVKGGGKRAQCLGV